MVNIDIFVKNLFENICDDRKCKSCKLKDTCEHIHQFVKDIKDMGLTDLQIGKAVSLYIFILREQRHVLDFGRCPEEIIRTATENGFELEWLINRWETVIKDKDELKPIIAAFPKHAKTLFNNIVSDNVIINKRIADYIIHTSENEYAAIKELIEHKEEDTKFKDISDDELLKELRRRNVSC